MATFDLGRVTPLYKGDYSASASYELNDVVLYNGNLYWHVQATATVGILPTDTTVWKLAFADEGVRAEIRGYADDAQASKTAAATSASQASASASNASASASQAALSAQTAQSAETGATAAAQTASTKASEASTSAQSAASSAQTATDKATLATQKASAAADSAAIASEAKTAAINNAQLSVTKADEARSSATQAALSATSAQEYDESAQQSAVNAQTAQGLAETAQTGAETAQGLAEDARDLAQQYAESIDPEHIYSVYPTDTAEGPIASFSDGADAPVKSLVVGIEPVQSGTGDPSPENVRPITGFTGAKIEKRGNLLPPHPNTVIEINGITFTNNNGKYTVSGTATARANCDIPISLPAGTYTFAGFNHLGQTMNVYVMSEPNSVLANIQLSNDNTVTRFTLEEPATIIRFTIASGITINNGTANLMIVSGSETPTAWSPYSGKIINIPFPTEAGTVYGGTLDVTNGVLTVDRAEVDMGTLVWSKSSVKSSVGGSVFTVRLLDIGMATRERYAPNTMLSSAFASAPDDRWFINDMLDNEMFNNNTALYVSASQYDTHTDFKAAMNGVQLCYELATPVTYQLTHTEVKSLLGQNNIWSDTGDTSVEYRADTSAYIAKKIAEAISALS